MNEQEIRQGIANLPPTAQTKPLLDAVLNLAEGLQSRVLQLEGSQNKVDLAAMRQELDARKLDKASEHPRGLCRDATCDACATQAQDLLTAGRGSVQDEIDAALLWAGGPAWQGKIAGVVQKWLVAGRPEPTSEPALHILAE